MQKVDECFQWEGNWKGTANGHGALGDDEDVSELDSGDGCTTL